MRKLLRSSAYAYPNNNIFLFLYFIITRTHHVVMNPLCAPHCHQPRPRSPARPSLSALATVAVGGTLPVGRPSRGHRRRYVASVRGNTVCHRRRPMDNRTLAVEGPAAIVRAATNSRPGTLFLFLIIRTLDTGTALPPIIMVIG